MIKAVRATISTNGAAAEIDKRAKASCGPGNPRQSMRKQLSEVTEKSGVYRFLDEADQVLYVGKAANLQVRLRSYFAEESRLAEKTRHLMSRARRWEVTVTKDANEALILEHTLIKEFSPRYNVLFRDDKTYPYIRLNKSHSFPGLFFYRGTRRRGDRYFGPYANVSVRATLSTLQKLFHIRNCSDKDFSQRQRPCLQHQLKRCSAPCVGLISTADYAADLRRAVLFLEGQGEEAADELLAPMRKAAATADYEKAAVYRDKIATLRQVQKQYRISDPGANIDVIGCYIAGRRACVQLFTVRNGVNMGNQAFFSHLPADTKEPVVLAAFLSRYYARLEQDAVPSAIMLSHAAENLSWLKQTLAVRRGAQIKWYTGAARGQWRPLLDTALTNARLAVMNHGGRNAPEEETLGGLARWLDMPALHRIECFDISHTQGQATTASMVVYTEAGISPSLYRRFNINDIRKGDDYAAMEQAVERHYRRVMNAEGNLPELLLIDGGLGQVRRVVATLQSMGLADSIGVIGLAKGEGRRPEQERVIYADGRKRPLPKDAALRRLLLQIRDEAHRFALHGHRRRRRRLSLRSPLESVPGIGSERRRMLLSYFGGQQGVVKASVTELTRVPGIGPALARQIHTALNSG